MKRKYTLLIGLSLIFLLGACSVDEEQLKAVDASSSEKIILEIPAGSAANDISVLLYDEGLIKSRGAFLYYLKQNSLSEALQAGKYELSKSMDVAAIAEKLSAGDVFTDTVDVLIPEGYELRMIADKFAEEMGIDAEQFLEICNTHDFDYKFMDYLPKSLEDGVKNRLEGYLFPATYTFKRGTDELTIITAMLDKFDSEISQEYYAYADEAELSFHELITLASIVEREGADYNEFPRIAGVFMNRYIDEMLFQSCATVQYILEERKDRLSSEEIAIDNPYNTYMYSELPPGPIASPGAAAIKAAFYPDDHDFYYFVAAGDGTHIFSRTLEEHNAAVSRIFGD